MWLSYYEVWQFNFAGFFYAFRITKCGKVILLQSVSGITKCETDCYYKVRQVLQSATVIITKWEVTWVTNLGANEGTFDIK